MKLKKFKNLNNLLMSVAEFCEGSLLNEVCGLVGFDGENYILQEGKNIAADTKNNFILDPLQYLMFKNKYKVISIFHSHLIGDEEPSDFDVLMSENSCVPFSIYSLNTKKHYVYRPREPDADLELLGLFEESIQKQNISIDD